MEGAGDAGSAGETSLEERTRWTVHFNVTPLTKTKTNCGKQLRGVS